MRKTVVWVVAVGAVLGMAVGSVATAAPQQSTKGRWGQPAAGGASQRSAAASVRAAAAAAPDGARRLIVVGREDQFEEVDTGEPGLSPGDYVVFTERLRSRDGRRPLGYDTVRCTDIFERFRCDATFTLRRRGNIEVAGTLTFPNGPGGSVLAITGGTGEFEDAEGEVHLVFSDDPEDTDVVFVFHLVD